MIFLLGICLLFASFGYLMLLWRLWLVDGTMDAGIAILLGGGAMLVVGYGIRNISFPLLWIMAALMGGGSILYIALDDYYERTSMRRRYLDDIRKLKQQLQFNTADWHAWRDLGKAYAQLEMYTNAVEAYKNAISLDPPDGRKLRLSLNDALDMRKAGKMSDVSICPNCKEETPRGSKACINCGTTMRFEFVKFISTPDAYGNVIRYIVLGISGAAILALIFSQFSLEVKAIIAMATVIVCAFLIWRSVENV
ncbi:MAG: tetratricopeptide repeat protein [Abditibacteriaceae bacterium]